MGLALKERGPTPWKSPGLVSSHRRWNVDVEIALPKMDLGRQMLETNPPGTNVQHASEPARPDERQQEER